MPTQDRVPVSVLLPLLEGMCQSVSKSPAFFAQVCCILSVEDNVLPTRLCLMDGYDRQNTTGVNNPEENMVLAVNITILLHTGGSRRAYASERPPRAVVYLAHLEPVSQLALVASVSAPPGGRHAGLEGSRELPLLGTQLAHVIQVGTQASRRPGAAVGGPLPQLQSHLPVLQGSQGLDDLAGLRVGQLSLQPLHVSTCRLVLLLWV